MYGSYTCYNKLNSALLLNSIVFLLEHLDQGYFHLMNFFLLTYVSAQTYRLW